MPPDSAASGVSFLLIVIPTGSSANSSAGHRQRAFAAWPAWPPSLAPHEFMPEAEAAFEPISILRALVQSGVDFIVVGGIAAAIHGSPVATTDLDIVPRRERANLQRLSEALDGLEARVYASRDESHRFAHDGSALENAAVWNLSTRFGGLDITFEPAGTRGFPDLSVRAVVVDLDGTAVRVAALDDVIRSKAAADREKDRATLPLLRRLRDLTEGAHQGRRGRRPRRP